MALNVNKIESVNDMQCFVEGCINDFESGVSTKEETLNHLRSYTIRLLELSAEKVDGIINDDGDLVLDMGTAVNREDKLTICFGAMVVEPEGGSFKVTIPKRVFSLSMRHVDILVGYLRSLKYMKKIDWNTIEEDHL